MRTEAVFFDLDNTLYSYDRGADAAEAALGAYIERQFGIPGEEAIAQIYEVMRRLTLEMGVKQAATHDRMIRFQRFLQERKLPIFPYAGIMYDLYWGTLLETVNPEPGVHELIRELRRRNLFIGCGTNMTSRMQYLKIQKLGMGSLIDDMITSEEACTEKPDPEFFRYCADKHGFAPEHCVFIGDNYSIDVQGSMAAGMHGILYQTPELAARHCTVGPEQETITDYRDLEKCLQMILGK